MEETWRALQYAIRSFCRNTCSSSCHSRNLADSDVMSTRVYLASLMS